mmetsp:Transcript_91492/g.153285  ORF Transcript_91492/g.153285 Transcript_91492/m.153285 type:complete len:88 (-) Transcript_91492:1912-2175(-)
MHVDDDGLTLICLLVVIALRPKQTKKPRRKAGPRDGIFDTKRRHLTTPKRKTSAEATAGGQRPLGKPHASLKDPSLSPMDTPLSSSQ